MGRGSKSHIRWRADRQRRKKAREARQQAAQAEARQQAERTLTLPPRRRSNVTP